MPTRLYNEQSRDRLRRRRTCQTLSQSPRLHRAHRSACPLVRLDKERSEKHENLQHSLRFVTGYRPDPLNRIPTLMIKDSSLPAKLILAFGLLIAIVVCVGVVGLRHVGADAELERIVDGRWEKVQLSRQAQGYSNLNNRITMQIFLVENEDEVHSLLVEMAKNSERISSLIETLRTRVEAPEEQQLLNAI